MKFLSKVNNEEQLVIDNFGLVMSIAYKYRPQFPDDHDDLIQIGSIGLLKAIRTFDASLGNQLSTLATIAINREILKRLSKKKLRVESILDGEYDIVDDSINEFESDIFSGNLYTGITSEDKKLLYMRFYLNCTFEEIGDEFNKTRQWANLKINNIVKKIKENEKENTVSNRS